MARTRKLRGGQQTSTTGLPIGSPETTTNPVTDPVTTSPVTDPVTTSPVTDPVTTSRATGSVTTTNPVTGSVTTTNPVTGSVTTSRATGSVTTTKASATSRINNGSLQIIPVNKKYNQYYRSSKLNTVFVSYDNLFPSSPSGSIAKMYLTAPGLPKGTYTKNWGVVSSDGKKFLYLNLSNPISLTNAGAKCLSNNKCTNYIIQYSVSPMRGGRKTRKQK